MISAINQALIENWLSGDPSRQFCLKATPHWNATFLWAYGTPSDPDDRTRSGAHPVYQTADEAIEAAVALTLADERYQRYERMKKNG